MIVILQGTIKLKTTLKIGDYVKIIFATTEELLEVTAASENEFKVKTNQSGKVFVFGKQVNDFHSVDYDALTTLNIAATQELLLRIKDLEQEKLKNANLQNEIQQLKLSFEERLNKLERRMK